MAALRYLAILIVIAALAVLIFFWNAGQGDPEADGVAKVTMSGETFNLEVAADEESITQGLMHRESIPDRGGMIFVFARPRMAGFWMKNCLVDIDLLYLDESRRVFQIEHMKAQPPQGEDESDAEYDARVREDAQYPSIRAASYVIELKAGTIEDLGIEVGDRIEFDHVALRRLAR